MFIPRPSGPRGKAFWIPLVLLVALLGSTPYAFSDTPRLITFVPELATVNSSRGVEVVVARADEDLYDAFLASCQEEPSPSCPPWILTRELMFEVARPPITIERDMEFRPGRMGPRAIWLAPGTYLLMTKYSDASVWSYTWSQLRISDQERIVVRLPAVK